MVKKIFAVLTAFNSKPIAAFLIICLFLIFLPGRDACSAVSGSCANCHTMHNSQNGAVVDSSGPYAALLTGDCVGCHSASDPGTGVDPTTGAPIVYNTSGAPTYGPGGIGLAGGNFYWVAQGDDAKGHNVFSDNPDDALDSAPGHTISSCGVECCHNNLHAENNTYGIRQGCTKCHMMGNAAGPSGYHHKDDSDVIINTPDEGWFRFLSGHSWLGGVGVTGIEDDDWLYTFSDVDHNEYLGNVGTLTSVGGIMQLGNTLTAYCTGCHNNFHIETSGGQWVRHPSDAVIPDSGEYAAAFGASGGVGTYDPAVPIARPSLTAVSSAVNLGTDLVMCTSCHKAHGSPYDDMLRWDYADMQAGGGADGTGCFKCHTAKDGS